MLVVLHRLYFVHEVHKHFEYEVIDGQHFIQVYRNFKDTPSTHPDLERRRARAMEMQKMHIAKLYFNKAYPHSTHPKPCLVTFPANLGWHCVS